MDSSIPCIYLSGYEIDELYRRGSIKEVDLPPEVEIPLGAKFVIAKAASGQSAICNVSEGDLLLVDTKSLSLQGISPRDSEQICLFYGLQEYDLIAATGAAGTGKTTIALSYALEAIFRRDKKVVLCKPTSFVTLTSNAIAAIPGDHREKLAGYIDSYLAPIERLLGNGAEHYLYEWEEQGTLKFQPLELIRGMHFEDTVVICDEAQNTSIHELMSLVSRVGEGSTMIILGDPHQVDTGMHKEETGLWKLLQSPAFLDCDFACSVALTHQYRGPMARLAAEVLAEV
jgi:PhoH-like ATPase